MYQHFEAVQDSRESNDFGVLFGKCLACGLTNEEVQSYYQTVEYCLASSENILAFITTGSVLIAKIGKCRLPGKLEVGAGFTVRGIEK